MSLSAHLVDQYEDRKPALPPRMRPGAYLQSNPSPLQVKQDPDQSWVSGHGESSMMSNGSRVTSWSEERVAQLQARLARKLGPEYVTQRPGPGGGPKLSYIEGWKVINLANEVFGFNGWSSSITQLSVDFLDVNKEGRCSVNVTAIVRITLQDGCFHEDVGCGQGENIKSKGAALDKAKKEAVTDATKRCLKTFGNVLGNCLYDKEYAKEVVKMRVPPPKFNQNDLERRPEFAAPAQSAHAQPQAPHQAQSGPSGPVQPAASAQSMGPPAQKAAPTSPLKTVAEVDLDVDMEALDGEFLDEGGESFYDMEEISEIKTTTTKTPQAQAKAGPSKPAYQHRHRPDPPQAAVGGLNEAKKPFVRAISSEDAAARRLSAIMGDAAPPAIAPANNNVDQAHRSSGGSSSTSKPPASGFGPQATKAAGANGQSARALAIQSAMRAGESGPIRSVSPQIPAGGVDAVAARATVHMKTYSAKLELEDAMKQVENSPGGALGGFASARGMKRSISEDQRKGSQSPTKQTGQARQALGELPTEGGDFGQKRPRA